MAKEKTTKTVEFDVATGWKNQTLDLNKYNYDIQFISGKTEVTPPDNIVRTASGNNATLTVETPVEYYATIKVDKTTMFDGHLAKLDDNNDWDADNQQVYANGVRDISDAFVDATYKYKGKNINLEKYNSLSEAEQAKCTFVNGTLKLTIQTGAAHSSNASFEKYRLTTDSLYTLEDSWKETDDYTALTGADRDASTSNVKFLFGADDLDNIVKSGKSGYKYAFYTEDQYAGLEDSEKHTVSDLHIYKIENGKTTDITKSYIADAKAADDQTAYNQGLLDDTSLSNIILKNYGKTGDAWLLDASGEKNIDLLTKTYTINNTGKAKYTGTRLNEVISSSKSNETFNLITGTDTVNFEVTAATETTPLTGFGHDTVKINDGESLELKATGLVESDTIVAKRSGNNIVVSATRGTETKTDLGQVTIQGYNVGSSIDFEGFGADVSAAKLIELATTAEDATHKGNKFTGTVFADKAESTVKNETFSLGTTVGTGRDKVSFAGSFGKDTVNFVDGENLTLDFANTEGLKYATKGNDVVIKSDVKYYAIAEVTRDFVVDGNIRDNEGNLIKQSIVNNLESATYKVKDGTDTIDLDAYKKLSAKAKANYEFVTGTIKLTLQTNVAHSNETRYNEYVFATDSLYKMPKNYQWPEEKQFNTDRNVSIVLNNADVVDAIESTGSTYQDETDQGLGAMILKNMEIYKVVNDADPATITDEYLSALETAGEDDDPDKDTVAEGYFNKQVSGQVTLKNYMKLAEDNVKIGTDSLKAILQGGADAQIALDYSSAKKGQTIKGTFLNENITGSKFADKIYAVGGTDTITGGQGADKMYAGTGADTFVIAKGDATGKGDTIYDATSADKVNFADGNNLTFAKSGNNLVVTHTSTDDTPVVDNVTFANYFKSATPEAIKINDTAVTTRLTTDGVLAISGKGKIAGTDFNDAIAGSAKADKITTGDGADTITAGKGNDTITIDGAGAKTLIFDRASGKDTVVVTAGDFDSANLLFDGITVEGNKLTYDHSVDGNDLIVKADYAAVPKSGSTPAQKASTATVTVKDYFADGLAGKVTIGGSPIDYATATLNSDDADARLSDEVDTTGNNIYNVTSTTYTPSNEVGAKDYSTAIIVDESGNDLYNVASLNANTYINDKAGKDALNIKGSDPDNVCMIFDVLSKTASESAALYKDNSLFIFDSHNLDFDLENGGLNAPVGGVEIANFIKVASNGKYSVGAGAIETINFSSATESETWSAMSSSALDRVRGNVAAWLSENSYDSAMEVINEGSKDDIQELLQIYNPEYTPQNA